MASDGIMLTINDKGELAEFKEPYAGILVETEEDYSYIEDALNIVVNLKINLTDEEAAFLKQYAEVYEEERKDDITANPIVVFKIS